VMNSEGQLLATSFNRRPGDQEKLIKGSLS
jgi:hypothetical protein